MGGVGEGGDGNDRQKVVKTSVCHNITKKRWILDQFLLARKYSYILSFNIGYTVSYLIGSIVIVIGVGCLEYSLRDLLSSLNLIDLCFSFPYLSWVYLSHGRLLQWTLWHIVYPILFWTKEEENLLINSFFFKILKMWSTDKMLLQTKDFHVESCLWYVTISKIEYKNGTWKKKILK